MRMRRVRVERDERGIRYAEGKAREILGPGVYWLAPDSDEERIECVSVAAPWFQHRALPDLIDGRKIPVQDLVVVDVQSDERARVWVDGHLARVLEPGLHGVWRGEASVVVEIVEAEAAQAPSVIY